MLGGYPNSLENYLKAQKINPNNALLNFKIGVCYRKINIAKSLEHLLKSEELDNNCHDSLYYWLGYAYQRNYKFDEAINSYKNFKNKLSPKAYSAVAADLNKAIQECETGIVLVAKPVKVFIDNIVPSINTEYANSPFISQTNCNRYIQVADQIQLVVDDPSDKIYLKIFTMHQGR